MRKSILLLLTIMILISGGFPQPVYADTENRALNGSKTVSVGSSITYVGGAADYTVLNSDDANTSYAKSYAGSSPYYTKVAWPMEDFVTTHTAITQVAVYMKAKREAVRASGTIGGYVYIDSGWYIGSPTGESVTTSYATYTTTYATNPKTGLAWVAADLNAASFGFQTGSDNIRITYMYMVVTYAPPNAPTVSSDAASSVSANSTHCWATLNGEVTDDGGGADIDARGFAYGTTSNATLPGNEIPPATYSDNWTEFNTDFGEIAFSYTANLSCCTTYYYRAYAHNSQGWAYGDEQSLATMCNPDIESQAATYVGATTARLNSKIIDDGNQLCDVRFCYGITTGNCTADAACSTGSSNCTSYNTTTAWAEDVYATGATPYLDITSLLAGTTYYYCSQARNDYACTCGGELSFTTESGISEPTDLEGISTPTTVSLAWVKGTGSTNTLIRSKIGSYPTSTADGTLVYFDSETSVMHEELTSGTTYYYMAWGESGGAYSSGNATLIITTLAEVAGSDDLSIPETPSQWFTAPDYTNMVNMPFYSIVNFAADQFSVPYSTMWYMLALTICVAVGVFFYSGVGNNNLLLSIIMVGVAMVMGSFMRLIPMWHLIPYVVFALVGIFVGERR